MHRTLLRWGALVASPALVLLIPASPGQASETVEPSLDTYSAPLQTAIGDLPVGVEDRTGYSRDLFNLWIDQDGDGCDTREEVLIAEAVDPPTVGSGCALTGGSWYSYYDQATWTATGDIDIDHLVPLAEAWDSGASAWTSDQRETYANDLGDDRDLVGVTDNVNQSKSDQDPSTWMPDFDTCRYLGEWVAVKIRWALEVDTAEQSALESLAGSCENVTITVEHAI